MMEQKLAEVDDRVQGSALTQDVMGFHKQLLHKGQVHHMEVVVEIHIRLMEH
jgi:hypothetical protein